MPSALLAAWFTVSDTVKRETRSSIKHAPATSAALSRMLTYMRASQASACDVMGCFNTVLFSLGEEDDLHETFVKWSQ